MDEPCVNVLQIINVLQMFFVWPQWCGFSLLDNLFGVRPAQLNKVCTPKFWPRRDLNPRLHHWPYYICIQYVCSQVMHRMWGAVTNPRITSFFNTVSIFCTLLVYLVTRCCLLPIFCVLLKPLYLWICGSILQDIHDIFALCQTKQEKGQQN